MKFVCPQSTLSSHLSLVGRAVSSRPTRPVLANIWMAASLAEQTVTFIGFDETLGIRTTFLALVEADGVLTVPAKLLENIVSRLPSEDIQAEQDDQYTLTLQSSSGKYEVRGLSAEDYPALPQVETEQVLKLSAEALLDGLRGSIFASSNDETKQVLTGVHLLVEADALEFAATDGHRLAVVRTVDDQEPRDQAAASALDVTVPGRALRELERMLQAYGSPDPVAVRLDSTQVVFELGTQQLTTRLLEGPYPHYRQLIPRQFLHQVVSDRKALMAALERIAVLAEQKGNIVKLSIDSGGTLAIAVEAQEVGSGREQIPVQVIGDGLDIAFNVRYLLDGLKALGTTEVQLQCNSPTTPAILTPLGPVKMTYLVMPVQLRNT